MQKIVFFIVLYLAQLSSICAVDNTANFTINEKTAAESKAPAWSFGFSLYNDFNYTGLALNADDLFTYAYETFLKYDNFQVNLINSSYTDRYHSRERFDELLLTSRYNFHFKTPWRALSFDLTPALGLLFAGNIGGELVQNALHSIIQVPLVIGKYPEGHFAPVLELDTKLSIQSKNFLDDAHFVFSFENKIRFAFGFSSFVAVNYFMKIQSAANYIGIGLGWADSSYSRPEAIYKAIEKPLSGPKLSLVSKAGILASYNEINYNEKFSTAKLSLVFNMVEGESFKERDLTLDIRAIIIYSMTASTTSMKLLKNVPITVNFSTLRIFEANPDFSEDPRLRRNIGSILIGMDFSPEIDLNKFGWLNFFAGASFGLQHADTFKTLSTIRVSTDLVPVLNLAAGLRWYGLQLLKDKSAYGIIIGLQVHLPFEKITVLPNSYSTRSFEPHFGFFFGLTIAVDL